MTTVWPCRIVPIRSIDSCLHCMPEVGAVPKGILGISGSILPPPLSNILLGSSLQNNTGALGANLFLEPPNWAVLTACTCSHIINSGYHSYDVEQRRRSTNTGKTHDVAASCDFPPPPHHPPPKNIAAEVCGELECFSLHQLLGLAPMVVL